jgi:HEAT repeat protein
MKTSLTIVAILTLIFLIPTSVNADSASDEEKMRNAVETLRTGEDYELIFAASELMELGPKAIEVLPELVEIAGGSGNTKATYPIINISVLFNYAFGGADPEFGEKTDRVTAGVILKSLGDDVIPFLVDYLDSDDPTMKIGAAYGLTGMDEFPLYALPDIYPMFHSDDPLQRITAAQLVSVQRVDRYSSLPLLEGLLDDIVPQVRAHAVNGISFFREECDVFEPIISMFDDEVPEVRAVAVKALASLEDRREDAAPILIEHLNDDSLLVRETALGVIGPAAKDAVPLLIKELKDNELGLRILSVLSALGRIGPNAEDSISLIIPKIHDENHHVRQTAAYALGEIGVPSRDVIGALIDALDDDWNATVRGAATSLGKFGPAANDALPRLLELAAENPFTNPGEEYIDFEKVTFLIIASAVTRIDPELDEGLNMAMSALQDEDKFIMRHAISALGRMGVRADEVVPILIGFLDSDDSMIRSSAVIALEKIGPAASDALPKLRELAKNDPSWDEMLNDYDVRILAGEAIVKIEGLE